MAKATRIVVWFDDGSWYEINPGGIGCTFMSEAIAASHGHHPPFQVPGPASPIKGPFSGPVSTDTVAAVDDTAGTCYYVNGVVVCP